MIIEPYCKEPVTMADARVRFSIHNGHIDVEMKDGALVIHSDGFAGSLAIYPRVTNEIVVRVVRWP